MPSGSSTRFGDTTNNAGANQMVAVAVVPGTWVSFNVPTGTTSIYPGYTPYVNASGESGRLLHHGQNYDGSNWGIGSENGIADAVLPASAMVGLFLNDDAPTTGPTPATVDWTTPGRRDNASYTDLQLKAPFLIGDGRTSGGAVQQFQVPPGATRMYVAVWDGVQQSNNGGSLSTRINLKRSIRLVK